MEELQKDLGDKLEIYPLNLLDEDTVDRFCDFLTEQELLKFLPEGCFRIRVTAGLERIKERFAVRMHGTLPPPVAAMLEKKHGIFDQVPCDIHIDSDNTTIEDAAASIYEMLSQRIG